MVMPGRRCSMVSSPHVCLPAGGLVARLTFTNLELLATQLNENVTRYLAFFKSPVCFFLL